MTSQAGAVEAAKSFLEASEDALHLLLARRPAKATEEVAEVVALARLAARLAHAYRAWPQFDPACLSLMREDAASRLFVPVLAFADLAGDAELHQVWSPTSTTEVFHRGTPEGAGMIVVRYPSEQIARNQAAIRAAEGSPPLRETPFTLSRVPGAIPEGTDWRRLTAAAPRRPASVQRRVEAARPDFDAMKLVWEAEWRGDPVKDPLVVGILHGKCFLVDRYDATKLERYVISEMCQNPRE